MKGCALGTGQSLNLSLARRSVVRISEGPDMTKGV